MQLPISGFIIAKNEERNIKKAITSLKELVDDLYVIDSGSIDSTIDIAKSLGAKVIYNSWPGYLKQKIYGEKLCKHDWIINIDADEELSPRLIKEINYIFESQSQNKYQAYRFKITNIHRHENHVRFLAPVTSQIRLYNRKFASFESINSASTHDAVLLKNQMENKQNAYELDNIVFHKPMMSLEQMVSKYNNFSTEQAKDMFSAGRMPSSLRIILEFPLYFLKAYFLRRNFIFGLNGFIDSMIFAFNRFLRLAKTRERFLYYKNRSKDEKEL